MTDAERQTLLEIRATIDAVLGGAFMDTGNEIRSSEWPAYPDDPDLIAPCDAAARAGVDGSTMRRWCEKHEIGKLYGGPLACFHPAPKSTSC